MVRHPRVWTHLLAKRASGVERGLTLLAPARHDIAHVRDAIAQLHSHSTAADVAGEDDAVGVEGPGAEGIGLGADADAVRSLVRLDQHVPRRAAVFGRTPAQVSIRTFPVIG